MKESATRTKILEVASLLFYKQGYNSTGINQIIGEADIARGSLYNHFPSKRDLLTAYIQSMEEKSFSEWEKVVKSIKEPRKKILALYDIAMDRQKRSDFAGCPFIKVGSEIPGEDGHTFELIDNQKQREKKYIETLLHEIYPDRKDAARKDMLANTLFLILEGALVSSTIAKDLRPLKDAKKVAESLLK